MTYLAIPKKGQFLPNPTEFIPIPVPRPENIPTTESTMPLERPQMAADALFSEAGRVVGVDTQIDLLSLPRGSDLLKHWWNVGLEKINGMFGLITPEMTEQYQLVNFIIWVGGFTLAAIGGYALCCLARVVYEKFSKK